MSLPAFSASPDQGGGLRCELTHFNSERQFKPFIYLNGRGADQRTTSPKGKVPPFGETFPLTSTLIRTSDPARVSGPGRVSGPDGWDPAAAGPASGRRPAADLASDSGSG